MITHDSLIALRRVSELEKLVRILKRENYVHMRDKVVLQEELFRRDLIDFSTKFVDNPKKDILKW